MTTVIAVYSAQGCIGRCDANCYNAAKIDCDCICGGRNHGVGHERAIENARNGAGLSKQDVERFARFHGYQAADLKVYNTVATPLRKIRRLRAKEKRREEWRKLLEAP